MGKKKKAPLHFMNIGTLPSAKDVFTTINSGKKPRARLCKKLNDAASGLSGKLSPDQKKAAKKLLYELQDGDLAEARKCVRDLAPTAE